MDELLIDIFGHPPAQTRLFDLRAGFHSKAITVAMDAAHSLFLMPVAVRDYVFTCEGDLNCEDVTELGFRNLTFSWSEEAKARGTGTAKIVMTNPDLLHMPCTFEVTLNADAAVNVNCDECEHCAGLPPVPEQAVRMMISHMLGHAAFGDLVDNNWWNNQAGALSV